MKRITVALIPRAADDLESLGVLTGLSITDVVNRAVSLYKLVEEHREKGMQLAFFDPETESVQRIHIT